MNKVVVIALGGTLLYGLVRLMKMQNVSDLATLVLVNPRVHQINLGGLYFRTEVLVNNPTNGSVTITKPIVSLTSGVKLLSQSVAQNKTIVIAPLKATQIDTIELQLSWSVLGGMVSNIIPKIPALITAFKSGNKSQMIASIGIPIEMSFSSYVNGLFYQSPPRKVI